MGLAERIKASRDFLGKNQQQMARELGISYGALRGWESNISAPGAKAIEAFIRLGFSAHWLLTGEGPMQIEDNGVSIPILGAETSQGPDRNGLVLVSRHCVKANTITDELALPAMWFERKGLDRKQLLCIGVTGDSMEPTLSDGDLVLVDTRANRIHENAVYALGMGDDVRIKRVIAHFDGSVTIRSDNPLYGEETVSTTQAQSLRVLGRVVWGIHAM
jgi:phage repressor protein C with HTH and peptisase S24 domain